MPHAAPASTPRPSTAASIHFSDRAQPGDRPARRRRHRRIWRLQQDHHRHDRRPEGHGSYVRRHRLRRARCQGHHDQRRRQAQPVAERKRRRWRLDQHLVREARHPCSRRHGHEAHHLRSHGRRSSRRVRREACRWRVRVGQALEQLSRKGSEIVVSTEKTLTVVADGKSSTVTTKAPTVDKVLEAANVTLDKDDEVKPGKAAFVKPDEKLKVIRIEKVTKTEEVR